eukprot:TRINITY_DN3089_c0_g1_i1.p1 TRINITY_DN3089_c0_g1~~TRINITY_DN3089_c0_g1_i1.p1  ORF type:complete len:693 (-),score=88.39 TRINITY_DN3089_c0_g1_i1:320-2398(-)
MPDFLAASVVATVEDGTHHERHFILIYLVLGPMAIASLISSAVSICSHLAHEGSDKRHALTIRVLLMVPIYIFVAWTTLIFRFTTFAKVIVAFQKFYECIVLLAFTQLLVEYLEGVRGCFEKLTHKPDSSDPCPDGDERCNLLPPLTWLPCVKVDSLRSPLRFLRISLGSVLTYVPVLLTSFALTFASYFMFGGKYLPVVDKSCTAIVFLYTSVSMYGLVLFYHANMKPLENVRPVMKLLSIKLLVMFGAWQEFGMKVAVHFGMLDSWVKHSRSYYTTEELAESILAGMLIVEMLLLSFFHLCIYPAKEEIYSQLECEIDMDTTEEQRGHVRRRIKRRISLVFNLFDLREFWFDLMQLQQEQPEVPEPPILQPTPSVSPEPSTEQLRPNAKFIFEFSKRGLQPGVPKRTESVEVWHRPLGIEFHYKTLMVRQVQAGSVFAGKNLAGWELETVIAGQCKQKASPSVLEEVPVKLQVYANLADFCTVTVKLTDATTIKDVRAEISTEKPSHWWSVFDVYISYRSRRWKVEDNEILKRVIDRRFNGLNVDMSPPSISLEPVTAQCEGITHQGERCRNKVKGFRHCHLHRSLAPASSAATARDAAAITTAAAGTVQPQQQAGAAAAASGRSHSSSSSSRSKAKATLAPTSAAAARTPQGAAAAGRHGRSSSRSKVGDGRTPLLPAAKRAVELPRRL